MHLPKNQGRDETAFQIVFPTFALQSQQTGISSVPVVTSSHSRHFLSLPSCFASWCNSHRPDRRRGGRQGYCRRTEGGVHRVNWASFVFGTSQSASARRGRSKSEYWMSQLRYGVSQGEQAERVIWGHSSVLYECGKGWKVPDHIQKKLNHRAIPVRPCKSKAASLDRHLVGNEGRRSSAFVRRLLSAKYVLIKQTDRRTKKRCRVGLRFPTGQYWALKNVKM